MEQSGQLTSQHLAQSEVREVLQYVPMFAGKTFVVALSAEMGDVVLAETILDLISLQRIGVKLVVVHSQRSASELLDRAAEVELKLSETSLKDVAQVLGRGQAALITEKEELVSLSLQLKADKILYLGEAAQYPAPWKGAINLEDAQALLPSSGSESIGHWAVEAVYNGVNRVHLLCAAMPGCLSLELFSNEGVGIMIYADSYQEMRPLTEEDIPELLAIIGYSIRMQYLLPRTYEEVVSQLKDYYVMSIDGNVVGSVAVHPYENGGCELACLFVKETHKGLGYGHDLVKFAEEKALKSGFKTIFALSTDAGGFFEQQMGYKSVSNEVLPALRRMKLEQSGRGSVVLRKDLLK